MTVIAPPRPPRLDDREALIEEARRRARKRRLCYGAFLLLALGAGLYLALGRGGGSHGSKGRSSPRPQPQPPTIAGQARQIARAGLRHPIGEAGLAAPGVGWAMNGLALFWTVDGGDHWRAITPPNLSGQDVVARVDDIAATDADHLWLAATGIPGNRVVYGSSRHLAIERTTDGGMTWRSVVLPGCYACGGAHLSFVDARRGFALTGVEPAPRLFITGDGGAGWRFVAAAPVSGLLLFTGARDGWLVSDPSRMIGPAQKVPVGGGRLYRTRDGGRTWQRVQLEPPSIYRGEQQTAGRPRFFGPFGVVAVRFRDRGAAQHVVVYTSNDGGRSWSPRTAPAAAALHADWGFPESLPFAAGSPRDWFLLAGALLYATHDAGRTWSATRTVAPPEPRAWDIGFTSATRGWAVFAPAGAEPRVGPALVQTTDGGRSWSALMPR